MTADRAVYKLCRKVEFMKNIQEILSEYGLSVPEDKSADFDKVFKTNRKGIAILPHDISIFNDNYDKQTHVECGEGTVDLAGSDAFIKLYRDQINISTNPDKHSACWFNFYKPERGKTPTSYNFGNGTDGGYADVVAGGYQMGYGKGNSKVFAFLNKNDETCICCADINCSGQIVGGNTFVDYLRSYGNIKVDGQISGGNTFVNHLRSYNDVYADGNGYIIGKLAVGGEKTYQGIMLNVHGKAAANDWVVNSDPTLKENIIKHTEKNALNKILNINFYSYDFKESGTHIDYGSMANEVPNEIQTEDGNGICLYSYIGLTAKSVQELNEKFEAQEKTINNLESRIEQLEARIANLNSEK